MRFKGQGGFTLVEFLVVLLIIGILAVIAIPAFTEEGLENQCGSETMAGVTGTIGSKAEKIEGNMHAAVVYIARDAKSAGWSTIPLYQVRNVYVWSDKSAEPVHLNPTLIQRLDMGAAGTISVLRRSLPKLGKTIASVQICMVKRTSTTASVE